MMLRAELAVFRARDTTTTAVRPRDAGTEDVHCCRPKVKGRRDGGHNKHQEGVKNRRGSSLQMKPGGAKGLAISCRVSHRVSH